MTNKQWKAGRGGLGVLFLPILLLACGLLINGCESDSVAPHDELPELTEKEAAQQAALVAVGISKVGPELLKFDGLKSGGKELGVYPYTFPAEGDVTGSIVLEYFTGGAGGTHSLWDDADYGLLYTPEGEALAVAVDLGGGLMPIFSLTFDLHGDINQTADTATVSGAGTFTSGDSINDFTLTNLLLEEVSSYPSGGSMDYLVGSIVLVVTYDGSSTAGVEIGGVLAYEIDLNTGIVTPVTK